MKLASIEPLGDTAVVLEGEIAGLGESLPPGVTDVVRAFGQTAIHFDPRLTGSADVAAWLSEQPLQGEPSSGSDRFVEIPVLYGGEAGADLERVAQLAGLTCDEVVRRHQASELRVGAVGFQPGFAYLEGLPETLMTPRLERPRARVAAGSVGIGGPYTGVYPSDSPGGWNLIGQTPLAMFDPNRASPALLRHGDRVRFREVSEDEHRRLAETNRPAPAPTEEPTGAPLLRVVSPGAQATLQDLGNHGHQHWGVSPGGAMDPVSLHLANLLVGNEPNAVALEAALVGPVLECLEPITLGFAGAACDTIGGTRLLRFNQGDRIDLRKLEGGARAYLSAPGGFSNPRPKYLAAQPLAAGDLLFGKPTHEQTNQTGWSLSGSLLPSICQDKAIELRVIESPEWNRFAPDSRKALLNETYRVSSQSSRMGLRCEGPTIEPPSASVSAPVHSFPARRAADHPGPRSPNPGRLPGDRGGGVGRLAPARAAPPRR